MKMVLIVCPQDRHTEFQSSLREHGIKAYTELRHVVGEGETGKKFGNRLWPEESVIVFMVIEDDKKAEIKGLIQQCKSKLYPAEGMFAFFMPVEEIL
jgi:hypothetical protein